MLPLQRDIPIVTADVEDSGRTVVIRALPLDTPTRVTDNGRDFYTEVWRSGAFDGPAQRTHKTVVQRNHVDANGSNVFGICRSITEDAGYVVTAFEFMTEAPMAGLARQLLREGTWSGASVHVLMKPEGSRTAGGMVERVRVSDFRHLAIVDAPAYPQAQVVAVRHTPADVAAYLDKLEHARRLAVKRTA